MRNHSARAIALCAAITLTIAIPAAGQQIQGLPRVSQAASVSQTIGVAEVTVDYHRPAVRGRQIWGALVPYDQVWRAGANENTVVTFSHPARVEGQDVAAGAYGFHVIPTEDRWTVIFSTNSTSWGSFSYAQEEDALRVEVKPQKGPYQEFLQYRFDHLTPDGAVLVLAWEELEVPIEIELDSHEHALAHIRNELRSLPGFSWMGWNSAANYCLQNNVNHEEALEWIERAIGMEENFSNMQVKAGLLDQVGRTEEAMALAAAAAEHANEAQVNQLGYQFLQRGQTDKAIELFEKNVRDYPDSWNVYDSLGEGLATKGDTAGAIEYYSKALEMAPENQKGRIEAILESLRSQ